MAEGIPVDMVEFSDNRPVLDMLLSRPMGLLALLDEESRFPRSTDRSLIGRNVQILKKKQLSEVLLEENKKIVVVFFSQLIY
jgi:myosin-3